MCRRTRSCFAPVSFINVGWIKRKNPRSGCRPGVLRRRRQPGVGRASRRVRPSDLSAGHAGAKPIPIAEADTRARRISGHGGRLRTRVRDEGYYWHELTPEHGLILHGCRHLTSARRPMPLSASAVRRPRAGSHRSRNRCRADNAASDRSRPAPAPWPSAIWPWPSRHRPRRRPR